MDLFNALLESHETQRSICRRLLAAIGEPSQRKPIFEELKAELAAHETAEERMFYVPLIAHDETVDAARHGIAEHHEMDEMVEELDQMDDGSAQWLETVGKLIHRIEHHLKDEEEQFFPQAREVLSRKQVRDLGEPYQDEHDRLKDQQEQD